MWFSLSDQTTYFLSSIAFGAVLAAAYDLLRAVRIFLKARPVHVMIGDVVFFIICGIMTSVFALPFNKGSVRAFIILGEAVGFLCYRLTIGSVMGRVYAVFARFIRLILKKICELLKKFFNLLLKAGAFVVYNVNVLIDHLLHFVSACRKRHKAERALSQRQRHNGTQVVRKNKGRSYERKKAEKGRARRKPHRTR